MKLGRSLLSLLLIITCLILFCGCWNYQDIEKLSIVAGFAIDKNEQGDKYLVTVEVVDFEMSGKEAKQTGKYIESEGATIFDAIRNVIDSAGKKMYWAHANIVIINQDIAKEGISPVLDMLLRDTEMREEMYVIISKEKTAKEVLKQEVPLSQTSSDNIENILTNQKVVGHSSAVQVYELLGILESDGISVALPAIHLTKKSDKKTAELDGSAIFKSDKLVGFLDKHETRYFLFITDKIKKGLLTINEDSTNQMDNITLEIYKSKTKVKPEFSDKKLTMNIEIKTEVALGEVETSVDYIKKDKRDKLKKDTEEKVKVSVEKVIKKVQNDFDTDIFGFGMITKANIPSVWRSAQQDGRNLFKDLKANVKVDITIKNSALASKAIKKGD
jgi:spore germination protein KC